MRIIPAYIDPGEGFVFLQNPSFLWGVLLGIAGSAFLVVRMMRKAFRNKLFLTAVILIILCILVFLFCPSPVHRKVVILGIDAMDPAITERMMAENRLPHFQYLKQTGGFAILKTVQPPESPVVWTSFFTGLGPGEHGIFDFIMADPKTGNLCSALNTVVREPRNITIGRFTIPLGSVDSAVSLYKGEPFWRKLSRRRIPAYIYFCPNTFPAEKISGVMLSGMGVPDAAGRMSYYTLFTTRELFGEEADMHGRIVHIVRNGRNIETAIAGPKSWKDHKISEAIVPLGMAISDEGPRVEFDLQGQRFSLEEKKWSPWKRVRFDLGTGDVICGITRFYLKSVSPELDVYMTPVNFDPERPVFPISFPRGYAGKVAKENSLYSTSGFPYDTWALQRGIIEEQAFLERVDGLLEERERILARELARFKKGVFFFYLDALDPIQHLFWRYRDEKHPLFENDARYCGVIEHYYEEMDQVLGTILEKIDKNTTLIVLSDHGFTSSRRSFNVNRWLMDHGYLYLRSDPTDTGSYLNDNDIDWERSRAYAFGFSAIYLNRRFFEKNAGLAAESMDRVKQEIRNGLLGFIDPANGLPVIRNVYFKEEVFKGQSMENAPDLSIGFNPGYRILWHNVLGKTPRILIADNKEKWSGDHLVDASAVPGVLFCNRKIRVTDPSILDFVPTLYALFNITGEGGLPGRRLLDDAP